MDLSRARARGIEQRVCDLPTQHTLSFPEQKQQNFQHRELNKASPIRKP